jgi:WD40 repeat protein
VLRMSYTCYWGCPMAEALTLRVTQRESRLVVAVGSIWALTSWTDANGRVMLASGGDDGTIRRWDASDR